MKLLPVFLLGLIAALTSYRLYRPGFFSMSDDMHVFRQQQFDLCLKDRQIPCRFIRDGGLGYGYPLFNYYPPLSYVIGETFHLAGISYVNSVRLVFIFTLLLGTISAYLFGQELYGKFGGLIVTGVFSFAPYRAVDVFVRGALAESLALNLSPLFFYLGLLLIRKASGLHHLLFVFATCALLLSHNLFSLIFLPLFFGFTLFFYPSRVKTVLLAYIQSFLIGAFFIVPTILERELVTIKTMTQGYFQFTAHFATLRQLFLDRSWGYGASLWGPKDDLSFQIGMVQWLLPLITIILSKNKEALFFLLSSILFLFLTHSRSTPIWQLLPFMAYYQFPWRFLGPTVFCLSLASGGIVFTFKEKLRPLLTIAIVTATILLNIGYFHEDIWFAHLTDQEKLNQENTFKQSNAGLQDYWPKNGRTYPKSFAPSGPTVLEGQADILSFSKNSNSSESQINVLQNTTIRFPQVYFPNLSLLDNGSPHNFELDPELGLIITRLESGNHHLILKLKNTPIRTLANTLSLIGLLTLFPSALFLKHET